jgi:bacterioferritin-associated ferredoxin
MYVCICSAVTDRQIREAAQAGARTLKDLGRDLGVGQCCGLCASCARSCLEAAHESQGCQAQSGLILAQLAD